MVPPARDMSRNANQVPARVSALAAAISVVVGAGVLLSGCAAVPDYGSRAVYNYNSSYAFPASASFDIDSWGWHDCDCDASVR